MSRAPAVAEAVSAPVVDAPPPPPDASPPVVMQGFGFRGGLSTMGVPLPAST